MKKTIKFLLKATVSITLFWYLLSKTELTEVFAALQSATLFWLILAFLLLYIGKFLTAYRWQLLLGAQGIKIPLKTLIASIFVGQFFNSFLPTTVGGDAVRIYDTAAHSKDSTKAITSVFVDRLIGVLALGMLAVLGLAFGYLQGQEVSFFVWPAIVVFTICLSGFVVIFNRPLAATLERFVRTLKMKRIADKIQETYLALHLIKDNTLVLVNAFLLSIALQVNVVFFYYFIGRSINLGVSLLYFFIIVPVALVILIVPFSINGIGLREGIFVFLLTGLMVPPQLAIALSLLSFGLTLTQGLLGGIIFAVRGANFSMAGTNRTT